MDFKRLSSNSKKLLDEILIANNPVEMLCEKFDKANKNETEVLRAILRELHENGYIKIQWADNKPYNVNINNSAGTYDECLAEFEKQQTILINNNSINIGNNNKIKNSQIAHNIYKNTDEKNFAEKHPIIVSLITGLITGFILLFSFWDKIVNWIEGLF